MSGIHLVCCTESEESSVTQESAEAFKYESTTQTKTTTEIESTTISKTEAPQRTTRNHKVTTVERTTEKPRAISSMFPSPPSCGSQLIERIFHGNKTALGSHPWVVPIFFTSKTLNMIISVKDTFFYLNY